MKVFDQSSWKEVDALVEAYQGGDSEAGAKLIESFDAYLDKYVRLLVDGSINFNDRDSRQFIGLYIKDETTRSKLMKKWQSAETRNAAYEALASPQRSCSFNTREDIKQELICILLKMAKRYVKKTDKSTFSGYIYSTFKFEVQRTFEKLTSDPLTFSGNIHISYMDSEYITENEDLVKEDPYEGKLVSPADDEYSTNWIHGITASDAFAKLSVLDRLIIRMYYVDQFNDREISEKTGFHINTINSRRRAIKAFIEREYGNGNNSSKD